MNTTTPQHYYPTTPLTGEQEARAQRQARRQEDVLLALFRQRGRLSPSQAHALYGSDDTPLTSIRRAINTLTERGLLVKTASLVSGIYGKPEHEWSVVGDPPAQTAGSRTVAPDSAFTADLFGQRNDDDRKAGPL